MGIAARKGRVVPSNSRHITSVQVIGPMEAAILLKNAAPNRIVSDLLVTKYAIAMLEDEWVDIGVPIIFDEQGRLADGQHRLQAIVESETAQRFSVVKGVDYASLLLAVDFGRKRSVADVLRIVSEDPDDSRHFKYSQSLPATAKAVMLMQSIGDPNPNQAVARTMSERVVLEFIFQNQAPLEQACRRTARVKYHVPLIASALSAGFFLFNELSEEDADTFVEELCAPTSTDGNPAWVLQSQVLKDRNLRNPSFSADQRLGLAYLIKAWNAFRSGRMVSRLSYRAFGPKREDYPLPE